jgi:diguanylate cyclase (GGDEF)-like protein
LVSRPRFILDSTAKDLLAPMSKHGFFASRFWAFCVRHRFAIRDLSLIAAFALAALYIAFAVDVFEQEGRVSSAESVIELDEALLVGGLVLLALLGFVVKHDRAQKREVVRRIAAERKARELAYQDGLTGLPNRRQFDEALHIALGAPPRAGAAHGLFLLDLNGFKAINDVHGHGVGDEALIVVAQRLLGCMREGDLVARFGGDEFAILSLHLADPEAATSIALRVIDALASPIIAGGIAHHIGAGIGIALIPNDATTATEAMRKSDVALYRAKAERRSALRFFESEMDASVRERAALETALREAIDADRIEPVFQPTVKLGTPDIVGFEMFPEWIGPDGTPVPTERFIAIAEETGLIHRLASSVLAKALDAARHWPQGIGLSANIYPSQLKDKDLASRVSAVCREAGFSPARLEVEVTESALVADVENAQAAVSALHAEGFRIVLDNFGTGYSSLYHLRNFKLDKIKIDRSFVQAMTTEQESASIVNALVGLGQGLGLSVAADGIDGADQASSLAITGCDVGQGMLFSNHLSSDETLALFTPG